MPSFHLTPPAAFRNVAAGAGRAAAGCAAAFSRMLYPPVCGLCGADISAEQRQVAICPACLPALDAPPEGACLRCAAPVPPGFVADGCPHCRSPRLHFDAACALAGYSGPMRMAVLKMKRPPGEPLAASLGRLLAERVRLAGGAYDVAACIPMHWTRAWVRGINSAEVLLSAVAGEMRLTAVADLLAFRRRIRQQSTLTPPQRWKNVRGSLRVSSAYGLAGARVLLVDDVMTTGATASEAARTLKKYGAAFVTIAVAARAVAA